MEITELVGVIMTLAVIIAYLNHRFFRLQTTTAIMIVSLLLSFLLIGIGHFGFVSLEQGIVHALSRVDFQTILMDGMLSFLLFAGGLTVDFNDLKKSGLEIGILATLGTLTSAFLVGMTVYYVSSWLSHPIPLIYCFLFGALISPTDPIAVLALFKEVKAPKQLHVTVAGESLFNDGIGIVLFLTLFHMLTTGGGVNLGEAALLFFQEAIGGIIYGCAIGMLAYLLIKPMVDLNIVVLITLAVTTGGYALAQRLGVSGPLAMVVAGIFLSNRGHTFHMSTQTREYLNNFWEMIDQILNVILFLLIGLELLVIPLNSRYVIAGLLTIPGVLLVRWLVVSVPITLFKAKRQYVPHAITILTWGGLRGGLAIALALAIPAGHYRDAILTMTYTVVAFSITVQGSTIRYLLRLSDKG